MRCGSTSDVAAHAPGCGARLVASCRRRSTPPPPLPSQHSLRRGGGANVDRRSFGDRVAIGPPGVVVRLDDGDEVAGVQFEQSPIVTACCGLRREHGRGELADLVPFEPAQRDRWVAVAAFSTSNRSARISSSLTAASRSARSSSRRVGLATPVAASPAAAREHVGMVLVVGAVVVAVAITSGVVSLSGWVATEYASTRASSMLSRKATTSRSPDA